METRAPLLIRLDDQERTKLEMIARLWGVSLASAVRRLIRDFRDGGDDDLLRSDGQ